MPKNRLALTFFIAFLFVGLASAAFFILSRNKAAHLNTDNTAANQVQNTNTTQSQDSITDKYPQHIVPIEGTDEVWYQIPELSLEIRISKNLADELLYQKTEEINSNGTKWDKVSFATKKLLLNFKNSCIISDAPLGIMVLVNGTLPNGEAVTYGSVRQFNGFYIAYAGPQEMCFSSGLPLKDKDVNFEKDILQSIKEVQEAIKDVQLR